MFCERGDMYRSLLVERPRLQVGLRELISNTINACDITNKIINNEGDGAHNQKLMLLVYEKGENLATKTLRLLTKLAGETDLYERCSSREIVRGSVVISNMENIVKILMRISKAEVAPAKTEGRALNFEVSSLANNTLETLIYYLRRLSSSLKRRSRVGKARIDIETDRNIQHAYDTAMDEDDLEYSHKTLGMISDVESLNRSINWCSKYLG